MPKGSENGIYLDGYKLTGFKKVPYNNSLYYLHYRFPSNRESGVHTIVSRDSGFVASLYGMESAESYSYALPLMHSHLPLIKEHLYDTICIGQTYQWQGRSLTAQGIYTDICGYYGYRLQRFLALSMAWLLIDCGYNGGGYYVHRARMRQYCTLAYAYAQLRLRDL